MARPSTPVPDLSSIVDCTKPHVSEVYAIFDLPRESLSGTTRQDRIENRNDLALPSELPDDSPQREAFEEFAEQECATSLQRTTWFDELRLDAVTAEDARRASSPRHQHPVVHRDAGEGVARRTPTARVQRPVREVREL
jgi:hypothetical protein